MTQPKLYSPEDLAQYRARILGKTDDLVSDFLYYGRRNDEDMPPGVIEAVVAQGGVTVDEIVAAFRVAIERVCKSVRR